jgi:putative oxidoreductase
MIRGSSMSSRFNINHRLAGMIVSAGRAVAGFLFACHGAASLFGVLGGAHGTDGGTVAFGAWPSWWASLIQLVGGALVMTGLVTRTAALLCSGSMAYAYFVAHQAAGVLPMENGGEAAALYAWIFLLLAVVGPGRYALDTLVSRKESAPHSERSAQRARRRAQAEFVIRDATLLRGVR